MGIRSTVKAIIINDGKILLNECHDNRYGGHFSFPGGGQHECETLHDAVIRECLEETGYTVKPVRFAALCETIFTDEDFKKENPEYTHRMYHVFICEMCDIAKETPAEKDIMQLDSKWMDIASFGSLKIFPKTVADNIREILDGTAPVFLGSDYNDRGTL